MTITGSTNKTTLPVGTAPFFVSEQLRSTLSVIDNAFHIHRPDKHSLTALFGSAVLNSPVNSFQDSLNASTLHSVSAQVIWDAINSPFFGETASNMQRRSSSLQAATRNIQTTLAGPLKCILEHKSGQDYNSKTGSYTPLGHTDDNSTSASMDIAHLVVLSKALATIKALTLQELLDDVHPLSNEISYWEQRESSRWSLAFYILQTLPRQLFDGICILFSTVFKRAGSGLFKHTNALPDLSSADSDLAGSTSHSAFSLFQLSQSFSLGLSLRLKPLSWIDMAKREMSVKRERLMNAQLWQAQCLGVLIRSNINSVFQPDLYSSNISCSMVAVGSTRAKGKSRNIGKLIKYFASKKPDSNSSSSSNTENTTELKKTLSANVSREISAIGAVVNALSKMGQDIPASDEFLPLHIDIGPDRPSASIKSMYTDTLVLTETLKTMARQSSELVEKLGRPSLLLRVWLPTFITALGGIVVLRSASPREIFEFFKTTCMNMWEYGSDFVTNWIVQPLENVLKTIRHDEAQLALLGSESLASDLDSLERMVIEFARDHGELDATRLKEIGGRVRLGDLTAVLQSYEVDIKQPLKNIIAGDLIRSLLIQIQKTKVDGELAVSVLDKLLKSNELNFAFLAVMPTLLITYVGIGWLRHVLTPQPVASSNVVQSMKRSLRNIERIFNQMDLEQEPSEVSISFGLLLCETCTLHECAMALPRSMGGGSTLVQDIGDLENIVVFQQEVSKAGMAVLARIWRTNLSL
ncbi:hypothetical protein BDV3_006582 [Batrachochytrium dendrobatidis]